MANPIVANVKEEHLGHFSRYFKEALKEYSAIYYTVKVEMKDTFFPSDTTDEDLNYRNKKFKEDLENDFKVTPRDLIEITDKLISIAERKIRETYPEEYDD